MIDNSLPNDGFGEMESTSSQRFTQVVKIASFSGQGSTPISPHEPAVPRNSLVETRLATEPGNIAGVGHTDADAGKRLVEQVKDTWRYVLGVGWMEWDGTRWSAPDGDDADCPSGIMREAIRCGALWIKTLQTAPMEDKKKGAALLKAETLLNAGRLSAAVRLARTDSRLSAAATELDTDPWLLNCKNVTVDLRTGVAREHKKDDMISKLADVVYQPGVTHPILDKYLADLDAQVPEMSAYLARCFGASLTGLPEEVLFLVAGDGGSGKTTLTEAFGCLMGDYAYKPAFETFTSGKRDAGRAAPELLSMRGTRFMYSTEGDEGAKLDAGRVKQLTGGEKVTARGLYAKTAATFQASWKLWLVSNFDPRADAGDTGLWRRITKIEFQAIPVEKRDARVKEALVEDPTARTALLNWAIKGCLDWQRRGGRKVGLCPPAAVVQMAAEYQEKQDMLADWWEDLTLTFQMDEGVLEHKKMREDCELWLATRALKEHYDTWCNASKSRYSRSWNHVVAPYLKAKGLVEKTRMQQSVRIRGYSGIGGPITQTDPDS